MNVCQTLTVDYEEEIKNTRKLLERVPLDDAHRNFKPHPKSMALDRLATHVAEIPGWARLALDRELFELEPGHEQHIAASTAELLEMFEKAAEEGRAAFAEATDADMQKNWTFRYGDIFSSTDPRTKVIRSFLNHLVHHRAQLGVYLRLNDIPIPGMYGPSADDAWEPQK
jgi:uncharacterized damage-inducible protein DinB